MLERWDDDVEVTERESMRAFVQDSDWQSLWIWRLAIIAVINVLIEMCTSFLPPLSRGDDFLFAVRSTIDGYNELRKPQ
jgi:hypothetical protein